MTGTITPQEKQTKVEQAPKGGPLARGREVPFFLSCGGEDERVAMGDGR